MAVIAGKEYPARDVGKVKQPQIARVQPDGSVLIERLPAVPFARMVDLQGFIVDVPLHNGGANRGFQEPYRGYIEIRKRQIGFIPADRCPLAEGGMVRKWLPEEWHGRRPCETTTTGKRGRDRGDGIEVFPLGHHCQCVLDIAAARARVHARVEAGRKSAQEVLRELEAAAAKAQLTAAQDANVKLAEVLDRVVDVLDRQSSVTGAPPAAPATAPPKSKESK